MSESAVPPSEYFVIVNIGPVQDFIASARRSRDLWFGSWLLSELSKTVAREIVQRENRPADEVLVFPAPEFPEDLATESSLSVANKIVALVRQDPATLLPDVQAALVSHLLTVWCKANAPFRARIYNHIATQQISDLIEFTWAAVPIENYAAARALCESLMAARKATRDFSASSWGAYAPKSSLDGQRESVIDEEHFKGTDKGKSQTLRRKFGVARGERLCGVGLLKRHGARGTEQFLSTSHMAALPLLRRWQNLDDSRREKVQAAASTYFETLARLRLTDAEMGNVPLWDSVFTNRDGHLLFEERLADFFDDPAQEKEARTAQRRFFEDAQTPRPQAYYALLHADGDRMGAAINELDSQEAHRRLSRELSAFASSVRATVEDASGSLIYAGGDDVLALLPLHTALRCTQTLARNFEARLSDFPVLEDGERRGPTLSAGLAICHHLDPLSDALQLARDAEKAAKTVPHKNALAITLSKRSGSDLTIAGHWGDFDERLEKFVGLHRQDLVPDGLAYEWRDLSARLPFHTRADETPQARATRHALHAEMLQGEALRILKRKKEGRGSRKADTAMQILQPYLERADLTLDDLAAEIIVARAFADAQDLAKWPLQEAHNADLVD